MATHKVQRAKKISTRDLDFLFEAVYIVDPATARRAGPYTLTNLSLEQLAILRRKVNVAIRLQKKRVAEQEHTS